MQPPAASTPQASPPELPPRKPPRANAPRSVAVLIATLEALGVLAASITLWAVISWPFWPLEIGAEFPLLPTSVDSSAVVTDDELIDRIAALDLARDVQIIDREGFRYLALGEVSATGRLPSVHGAVSGSGYRTGPMQFRAGLERKVGSDLIITLALQAGVFLIVGGALARFRLSRRRTRRIWTALPALGLGLAGGLAAILVSVVISAGLAVLGLPVQEQEWLRQLLGDSRNVLLLAPWVVVCLPMAEEVFFRGYVLRLVSRRGGRVAGILISSMMFAALHFNLSGFAIYLALGALFGWLQLRTSNLLAPVLAHVSYNGLVLLFAVIS